jgi:hypothetical protein
MQTMSIFPPPQRTHDNENSLNSILKSDRKVGAEKKKKEVKKEAYDKLKLSPLQLAAVQILLLKGETHFGLPLEMVNSLHILNERMSTGDYFIVFYSKKPEEKKTVVKQKETTKKRDRMTPSVTQGSMSLLTNLASSLLVPTENEKV